MPLAFVPAAPAGRHARLKLGSGEVGVVVGLAACHPQGGRTDVGAVQARADALDQLGHLRLAEAVVGAGGAGLRAVRQRVDGGGQDLGVEVEVARVGVQQLAGRSSWRLLPSTWHDRE